jgi:hypothetical protein
MSILDRLRGLLTPDEEKQLRAELAQPAPAAEPAKPAESPKTPSPPVRRGGKRGPWTGSLKAKATR